MKPTRLYLANDTSAMAAGAGRLADAWKERPEVQLVRTSARGAFYLEPVVEQDSPHGRMAWFNVSPDDLPRIESGLEGTLIDSIPFLRQQTRYTFGNFGMTEPLALDAYQSQGGFKGLITALDMSPEAVIEEIKISRLRGRGGAAFPVWNKWQMARQTEEIGRAHV